MRTSGLALSILGPALACLAGTATADDYVFTRIADGRNVPGLDDEFASIVTVGMNNLGEVVFTDAAAFRPSVYVGDGFTLRRVLRTSSRRDRFGVPLVDYFVDTIDDDRTIAGVRLRPDDVFFEGGSFETVFTLTRGRVLTRHFVGEGPSDFFEHPVGRIFLDAAGTPIYELRNFLPNDAPIKSGVPARLQRGSDVLFADGDRWEELRNLHANAAGDVAFFGTQGFGDSGAAPDSIVRVSAGGAETVIAEDGAGLDLRGDSCPVIDGAGNVTFVGSDGAGAEAIYRSSGGTLTELVSTTSSGFPAFDELAGNGPGDVVFIAGSSLFDGFDAENDVVIGEGNGLDGRVVKEVRIFQTSLNDRGQIAFRAQFEDETYGVYRAEPKSLLAPEGATNASFLPRSVRTRSGTITAAGTIDTGGLPFEGSDSASISLGDTTVPVFTGAPERRRRGLRYEGDDTTLVLRRPTAGTSRATFTLTVDGATAAAIDPDAPLELGFGLPSFNATGSVPLTNGGYNSRRATPLGPDIYPVSLRARLGRPRRHSLSMRLCIPALSGDVQPEDITVNYAGLYEVDADADDFGARRRGAYTYRNGPTRLVYHPARKTITVVGRKLDLRTGTTAGRAATVTVAVNGTEYVTSFRVTRSRHTARY